MMPTSTMCFLGTIPSAIHHIYFLNPFAVPQVTCQAAPASACHRKTSVASPAPAAATTSSAAEIAAAGITATTTGGASTAAEPPLINMSNTSSLRLPKGLTLAGALEWCEKKVFEGYGYDAVIVMLWGMGQYLYEDDCLPIMVVQILQMNNEHWMFTID